MITRSRLITISVHKIRNDSLLRLDFKRNSRIYMLPWSYDKISVETVLSSSRTSLNKTVTNRRYKFLRWLVTVVFKQAIHNVPWVVDKIIWSRIFGVNFYSVINVYLALWKVAVNFEANGICVRANRSHLLSM